jgi:hypothetical protein
VGSPRPLTAISSDYFICINIEGVLIFFVMLLLVFVPIVSGDDSEIVSSEISFAEIFFADFNFSSVKKMSELYL